MTSSGSARADVVLGGPLAEFIRLERAGRLEPVDQSAHHSILKLQVHVGAFRGSGPERDASIALDDPRYDPVMLAWSMGRLGTQPWREGYAELIRLAGRCRVPIGWRAGMARGAWARGEASLGLRLLPAPTKEIAPAEFAGAIPITEGAAIVAGTPAAPLARAFLQFLAERAGASPLPQADSPDPAVSELIADLLGAVVVDSHDELQAAWTALGGVGAASPSAALDWLTEPPPWPPASVEKLLARGGDRGLLLTHDLAAQLTPDPELRFWLIQSWLRPRRLVDSSLLDELVRAAEGRLSREPRFRFWLRSEWTAWARQRYRRVARLAMAAVPSGDRGDPSDPHSATGSKQ